nr:DNA-directed DNA polymerase [Tanacetum cinerariifolium]
MLSVVEGKKGVSGSGLTDRGMGEKKKHSNRRRIPNIVEPEIRTIAEIVPMADRTIEKLLQAPTKGYGEAIVILEILAENFEIKTNLLQLVQANKFHGFERDNPHTHISNFKRMTATLKYRDVSNDAIKLMIFPYSLECAARIWYEKEPPNSILTWDDLVNKFVNQFFPPSKTTHLKNEISRFTQRFEETFGEAWDRFKEMLRACLHHGFSELTQIDTFYNGLTEQDQDSLNAAVGVNLLNKTTREALKIIENKSKVRYSRRKSNVSRVNTDSRDVFSKTDDRIDKLADQISNLVEIVNKQVIAPAKAVEKTCVTCRGAHAYYECIATDIINLVFVRKLVLIIKFLRQTELVTKFHHLVLLWCKTIQIALIRIKNQPSTSGTLSSNTLPNPKGEMKAMTTRNGLAYEGPKYRSSPTFGYAYFDSGTDVPRTQTKPTIPYPSRLNDQKLREKATNQMEKFFQIFHDLHFDISFADALLLMPKFASTIKSLLANKDKLFELAKVSLNENCSAMLLKKLPEKLGDPGKFLIPCNFLGMEVCHALASLGASINLIPLSIWKKLSLPELTLTWMTIELADMSITRPKGVAEDVFFKVGKFHFPTDFIVVDFEADPIVPLILGRSFLRTGRALIDVYGEEITLRVNEESVTFNLNQTMRYSSTYDDTFVNRVDVIDIACEDFMPDVLDFQYNPKSSSPTLVYDALVSESDSSKEPIVKSFSPTLTPFEENPFQLPSMDLKLAKESKEKSFVEEPPELELKELPSHLEYAFLEDSNKLPVIKAKNLKDVEREALINILMEDDYKPAVQSQRRVNPKIHDVIKKEVIKLLDADYRKLNDATRKDHFLLPFMDQMLERLAENEFYCFLDGFSGFSKIARPMTHLLEKETPFVFSKECIDAFDTLKKKLTEAPILVVPDWNLPFELICDANDYVIALKYLLNKQDAKPRILCWVLLLQEFDITILDKKGSDNLAADHLSRLENPRQDVLENKDINENFPLETLGSLTSHSTSWFSDIANFHAGNFIKKGLTSQQKEIFFKDVKHYFWDDPYWFLDLSGCDSALKLAFQF